MAEDNSVTINGQLTKWEWCSKAGNSYLVAKAPRCFPAYASVLKDKAMLKL